MLELSSQDIDAIEEVHNRWVGEELAGSSSHVIELCTDDVMWIPPNAPPFVGKKAIAQYLRDSTVGLKDVQSRDVVICGSGEVAYLTSSFHSRFVLEASSEMQEATGTHLWILRKTGGSAWRVAIVAWSSWGPGDG